MRKRRTDAFRTGEPEETLRFEEVESISTRQHQNLFSALAGVLDELDQTLVRHQESGLPNISISHTLGVVEIKFVPLSVVKKVENRILTCRELVGQLKLMG